MLVTVPKPLALKGAEELIPAGQYEVTTEEEPLGDMMESAFRRLAATIYVPPPAGRIALGQIIDLESEEVDTLLTGKVAIPV
jgi:hypothetical protein